MQHFLEAFTQWWHNQTWPEIVGMLSGLLCVYLAARNNIWNWPVAIISTGLYIYVFAGAQLYADMLQNGYLTIINIYGWYQWSRKKSTNEKKPVTRITRQQIVYALAAIMLISPALGYTLIRLASVLNYQPPAYPYLDSFCTVVSLTAQVLMARKVLENWLLWIFVDLVYVGIYLAKDLHITAFLFAGYFVLAIIGYVDWRKEFGKQNAFGG